LLESVPTLAGEATGRYHALSADSASVAVRPADRSSGSMVDSGERARRPATNLSAEKPIEEEAEIPGVHRKGRAMIPLLAVAAMVAVGIGGLTAMRRAGQGIATANAAQGIALAQPAAAPSPPQVNAAGAQLAPAAETEVAPAPTPEPVKATPTAATPNAATETPIKKVAVAARHTAPKETPTKAAPGPRKMGSAGMSEGYDD
jgi:hypothetical protein